MTSPSFDFIDDHDFFIQKPLRSPHLSSVTPKTPKRLLSTTSSLSSSMSSSSSKTPVLNPSIPPKQFESSFFSEKLSDYLKKSSFNPSPSRSSPVVLRKTKSEKSTEKLVEPLATSPIQTQKSVQTPERTQNLTHIVSEPFSIRVPTLRKLNLAL
ncbi:hypothetical protein RCL1_000324 [Eukaryota sp. TZLM3-RCL]